MSTKLTITTPDLLTFTMAAKRLGVSRTMVYKLVEENDLHPFAIDGHRFLHTSEVERLQKERASQKE